MMVLRFSIAVSFPCDRPALPNDTVIASFSLSGVDDRSVLRGLLLPDDVDGGLRPTGHPELLQQVRHVVLHRLLGKVQLRGDLFVGLALRDELEDSALP